MYTKTRYIITNGKNYVAQVSVNIVTPDINKAFYWKKCESANNVLTALQKRKKNPLSNYQVQAVIEDDKATNIVDLKNGNIEHQIESVAESASSQTSKTKTITSSNTTQSTADKGIDEASQRAKEFIVDLLGDSIHAKEIVSISFHKTPVDNDYGDLTVDNIFNALHSLRILNNPAIKDFLSQELAKTDLETIDIEHKIELTNFNANEGYMLAKEMKDVRVRRRKIKDTITLLETMSKQFDLNKLGTAVEKAEAKLDTRTYTPRVREDLFIK